MPTRDHGLIPEFTRLLTTASHMLNEHTNQGDRCAMCRSAWPCERVVLAAHNLSAL